MPKARIAFRGGNRRLMVRFRPEISLRRFDREQVEIGIPPQWRWGLESFKSGRSTMNRPVNAAARLDRLPIGPFHWRVLRLVCAGMFFDSFDNSMMAGVL